MIFHAYRDGPLRKIDMDFGYVASTLNIYQDLVDADRSLSYKVFIRPIQIRTITVIIFLAILWMTWGLVGLECGEDFASF